MIFEKVTIDIIYMLRESGGKKYLVVGRENLTRWPKTKALTIVDLINITKFLWEDFICRHKIFAKFINNKDPENKA